MRSVVSDFAVFLTILSMVLVDYALGIPSPKLQVPNAFKVIPDTSRTWLGVKSEICHNKYVFKPAVVSFWTDQNNDTKVEVRIVWEN